MHWYGMEGSYSIMVMDLLGSSLEQLLEICGGRLSPKTVAMIALQAVGGVLTRSFGCWSTCTRVGTSIET